MTTKTRVPEMAAIDPDPLSPLNQMQRYLVHEFVDDYMDGLLDRRGMMSKISHIVGGTAAAATVVASLGVDLSVAEAQDASATPGPTNALSPISVPADDPSVAASDFQFDSGGVSYMAYEARPAEGATPSASPVAAGSGLILVCHENRGLTDHIRDVTRRLAKAGYVAVAVDLVSPEGGTAGKSPDEIPGILTGGDMARHTTAFSDVISRYETNGDQAAANVGMIGFCFGGGITWRTATIEPRLKAAVPYYGPPPPLEDVPNIKAAMLGVYSDDPGDFANNGLEDLRAALEQAGITYQINVYPGTQHAFNNDTGPRYNEEQALAAWQDALEWFAMYLGGNSGSYSR
jgi:carboxymethylenebutenolidase